MLVYQRVNNLILSRWINRCPWKSDSGSSEESRPFLLFVGKKTKFFGQLPMTDPWCCHIWCAMDPIKK